MKNKICWDGLKERLYGIATLIICVLIVLLPLLSLRAYAESSTVIEVMDDQGEIVEMSDGDGTVILEDPALLENEPESDAADEGTEEPEKQPDPTQEPDVDFEPTPEPSEEPESTEEPEATASPDPTATPEATDEPDPTPEPSNEPEVTPDPTEEPEITPLPSIEPTEEPTAHPTISPEVTDDPFPSYSIQIAVPFGWSGADSEKVKIYIADEGGTGWSKVEIRLAGGEWINAVGASGNSAELNVDVKRNGLLVVRITDPNGEYHSEQAEITCFDRNAPEVTAGVNDQMLHVETSDGQSGVAGIQVNGLLFTTLENGKLDVRIMELLSGYRQLVVRAYDYAGNFSDTVTLDNPYYVEEEESCPTPKPTKRPSGSGSASKPTATPKVTATPTVKPIATPVPVATAVPTFMPQSTPNVIYTMAASPTATPTVVTEYIPLGPGQPFKSGGNMQTLDMLYSAATNKQFITVQTRSGEMYYLVIDYDKPIDEDAEIYETYLLNLVDNRDLLSVLAEDEMPTPTPTPVVVYVTPEPTSVPVVQPTTPDGDHDKTIAMMALMMIVMVAGFAVMWFFKGRDAESKKSKSIVDEYDFDDDEEGL